MQGDRAAIHFMPQGDVEVGGGYLLDQPVPDETLADIADDAALEAGWAGHRATPALPGRMHVDQPKHWHPALRRGGQRTMRRHVRDKGRSAVDRVQHPDILGVRRHILPFLTRDAVLGKRSAIISRSPPWALR
jgi:hypothetical protein